MECKCSRCGHVWTARTDKPKACPACKSYAWQKPMGKYTITVSGAVVVGTVPFSGAVGNILRLTIERRWFDEIAAGRKKIEYREIKPCWTARLEGRQYDAVEFRNGYRPDSPRVLVECLGITRNDYYEIHLGRILSA